ncbi:MAG: response regulator [Gammaproteobacteria bacterium]|nr:response regulator [Gammaproteobacteria bacterium]
MNKTGQTDFSDFSMLDLFRMEVDTQLEVLNKGLLELEHIKSTPALLGPLMRAAHSIKGAARMVNVDSVVRIAHVIEDCLVALQDNKINFSKKDVDSLLSGIDLIHQISTVNDEKIVRWGGDHFEELMGMEALLKAVYSSEQQDESSYMEHSLDRELERVEKNNAASDEGSTTPLENIPHSSTAIRISIERLDKIYGLAGKSLVESHQLNVLMPEFWQIKHKYQAIISQLNHLQENLTQYSMGESAKEDVKNILGAANELRHQYSDTMSKLDAIDRRSSSITDLLHREIMSSRMRPISEILNGMPRMVRDLGRALNKDVRIQISGLSTLVDRHVLEKIDTPIKHLVQNAVDHGIELPDVREAKGKPRLATISLDVSVSAGMLFIMVEDDGKGVDFLSLKENILKKKLATEDELTTLDNIALLDFLFYPGFSTREKVNQISGRGVGLDLVKDSVTTLNGSVHASSALDSGTRFQLILPLTVSVLRVFLVTIGGESYSFPLSSVEQTIYVERKNIKVRDEGSFIYLDGEDVQLVHANSIFERILPEKIPSHLAVLVLKGEGKKYAVVIESSEGEQEISIQKLSSDFGKIRAVNSAAILNNGSLTLIIDTEEYMQAIDILLDKDSNQKIAREELQDICKVINVLVVDDSMTVREMERLLLTKLHYNVSVAEDGLEALEKLEAGSFDLLVTDIDMPNMDGIRLINKLRFRDEFADLPILIVSNREKQFIKQSVILDDKTRFYEKDIFSPKGFVEHVQQLEKLVDIVGV